MLENLDGACIFYSPQEREAFVRGQLCEQWYKRYPMLFDADDFRITRNQRLHHFNEWLAAIHLFRAYGVLSLVEKYQFKAHPNKQVVLRRVLPARVWDFFMSDLTSQARGQCPDLFVYDTSFSDYAFVEVKRLSEPMTKSQPARFEQLTEVSGRPVHVLRTKELRADPLSQQAPQTS